MGCVDCGLVDGGVVPASSNPNLLPSQHTPLLVFEAMIYDFFMNCEDLV